MDRENYKIHQKILIAVDCIVFGFDGTQLNALLVKRDFEPELGHWSLVGGFIKNDEGASAAAARVLHGLTGMKDIYMEQLHTFTEVNRDSAERVISIAYFSLIKITNYHKNSRESYESQWFPLSELPPLIFDHREMIGKATEALRRKATTHPVGFELLPAKFTIPQLRSLYEAIYEVPIDQRNFAKKIRALDILSKLDEKEKTGSKKGAFYYHFDRDKYARRQQSGIKLVHQP